MSILIFQRCAAEWGERGRSAALSAKRRELPKFYPLPPVPLDLAALAHNLEWSDHDGFECPQETVLHYASLAELFAPELHLSGSADTLELMPLLPELGGVVRLRVGQLARYEWNEHLGTGRVRHTVMSVGLFTPPVRADALARLPDAYLSHLIDLNQRRRGAGGPRSVT